MPRSDVDTKQDKSKMVSLLSADEKKHYSTKKRKGGSKQKLLEKKGAKGGMMEPIFLMI